MLIMATKKKQIVVEIEHYHGDTYMSFIISIDENGNVDISNTDNCGLADIDGDYLYGTDNDLYRIQADEPITEDEFEEMWNCYNENN